MINRQQQFTDQVESCTDKRLEQLSRFQISIVKHALKFPKVQRVVYSTCSIHEQENEQVVEEVYTQCSQVFDVQNVMPGWLYRGSDRYAHGPNCLRMSYDECKTNGFFVACFERKRKLSASSISLKDIQNVSPYQYDKSTRLRATADWSVHDVS